MLKQRTKKRATFWLSRPFAKALATRAMEASAASEHRVSQSELIEQLCLKADPRLRAFHKQAEESQASQTNS